MKNNPQRLYYIDWLRVLAMLSLFFFHADRFFDYYDWHVKNGEHNIISSIHISFFSQWMMPLFFILSGAAVFYSLKVRSSSTFLWERVKRIRSISLILAIILSLTGLVIEFGIKVEISENTPIIVLILTFIRCFRLLLWIIAIIGFGEKYLNFNNRFLGYANEAVLPFYILHQFVLLLIGYWVVQWQTNALVKYIVIPSLSFIAIMGLYDIIIKRFQVTRFLFGMKLIRTTGF